MEAIVAAAYLSGGHEAMVTVMNSLGIPILEHDRTSEIGHKALPSPLPQVMDLLPQTSVKQMEKIIGHNFEYPYYLVQALVDLFLLWCLAPFNGPLLD